MHIRRPIVAAFAATFLLTAFEARSAFDYFLKIDGIEGESTTKGFEKQIEISSWSWGVSNSSSAGTPGRSAGKSCPSDVHFSKPVDKASPPLVAGAIGGTVSPTAILIGLRGGGAGVPETYLKYELKNVMITSYQTGGSSGGGLATDSFSLRFTSATVSYYPQRGDGGPGTPIVASFQGGGC